jgi:hypothetical protein
VHLVARGSQFIRCMSAPAPAPRPAKNADDPTAWSPYEHHEDPDEIPHDVVGILALSLVLLALLSAVLWLVFGPLAAIIAGVAVAVWTVIRLSRRALRERVLEHSLPSKDLVERAPPPGSGGEWRPPVPPA